MSLAGFHPAVARWFATRLGEPTAPQREGWPRIRAGDHVLIAAPTGAGKTLAAFLHAIDELLREGDALPDTTRVLYVSPLKALANDVQKNLRTPLDEIRALDPTLPEIRVLVRSGDTPPAARAAMGRRPPHILVTTPESLFLLLTSDGGRRLLRDVRRVIVDEIHALAADKRGSHLALSLERLSALAGDGIQRLGLSATQRPLDRVARLLTGVGRECTLLDLGHRRDLDVTVEIPAAPLEAVCSHETWGDIHGRIADLVRAHRTTLVFVNTRKMAERIGARLGEILGPDQVLSHHGSLSRERRLEAERRLKAGELRALVATASLELGIDIGPVDLVVQIGLTPSIAAFLQRVGRSGHALERTPKGRLFPLTMDELAGAAGLLAAVTRGELDITPEPPAALDILAQQVVAACIPETWDETLLYDRLRRASPYRDLTRADFDAVAALHGRGRAALLHRDGIGGRLRATRRARLVALTSGGAIPDTADYRVLLEPEGTLIGTLNEDFAIESNAGDIFQLGNASWRILRVESGVVRVADAHGVPPSLPFWLGEAPARTRALAAAVAGARLEGHDPDRLARASGLPPAAAAQLSAWIVEGAADLGTVPAQDCVVAERFFDEAGGMQLVLHAPFGARINKAWGLALRKRFCRGFGFELQAAATDDALLLSLGPMHSFPLAEVFDYLHPATARDLLVQALLATPLFKTRWRWNVTRSLLLPRTRDGGRRLPAPLARMRADDLLAEAFPQVLACGETLPEGDLPIPWEHPIVRQTIEDCLTEALDVDGFLDVLRGLREGRIRRVAVDTPSPSSFARGILHAMPYAFLDDAPLEERRTQAVLSRRALSPRDADTIGTLDPDAVAEVRRQAWPQPESLEELHEALLWMGYATLDEVRESGWTDWMDALRLAGRAHVEAGRCRAAEARRDPRDELRGRLEALGPVFLDAGAPPSLGPEDAPAVAALETEGIVLRCRLEGRDAVCHRRLLARIQRATLESLRREIEPISAAAFWRFLSRWQHLEEGHQAEGPLGLAEVLDRLAGFEAPAALWERRLLTPRVRGYRPDWLDQLTLSGEFTWLRLWPGGRVSARRMPVTFVPRADLPDWLRLAATAAPTTGPNAPDAPVPAPPRAHAAAVRAALVARGPSFASDLQASSRLLPSHFDEGLLDLIAAGECRAIRMRGCVAGSCPRRVAPPSRRAAPLPYRRPDAGSPSSARRRPMARRPNSSCTGCCAVTASSSSVCWRASGSLSPGGISPAPRA